MAERVTIGQVINPCWCFDLAGSLRVHRLLVERSLAPEWRFRSGPVTTGPFECLLGYPGCGVGTAVDYTSWCELKLHVRAGVPELTRTVNQLIWRTMCSYPTLASLAEELPHCYVRCDAEVDRLAAYERGRTRARLNTHHKAATLVKNVRLSITDSGVCLAADVSFNARPTESSWELFWLAARDPPWWNARLRLATWLRKAQTVLDDLVQPRVSKTSSVKSQTNRK